MNHFLIINIASPTELTSSHSGPAQNLCGCSRTNTSLPPEAFYIIIIILYVHYYWNICWYAPSGMCYLFFYAWLLKICDVLWQPEPLMKFDLGSGWVFYLNYLSYYFHNSIVLGISNVQLSWFVINNVFFVWMLVGLCLVIVLIELLEPEVASGRGPWCLPFWFVERWIWNANEEAITRKETAVLFTLTKKKKLYPE